MDNREYSSNSYSNSFSLQYNSNLNKKNKQEETYLGINMDYDFQNAKRDKELYNKYSNIHPNIFLNSENRIYHESERFFGYNYSINYTYSRLKTLRKYNQIPEPTENKENNHSFTALVPIQLGHGRIEQVQDARHAIYLIEELSKRNRLNSDLTSEEVTKFAELISELKNMRVLDARLQRIHELEVVDSFLFCNSYITEKDANYFSTLTDYWDYGNRPIRKSGTRISFTVIPGLSHNLISNIPDNRSDERDKDVATAIFINGGLEIDHEKPLNLAWQNSLSLNGFVGTIHGYAADEISNYLSDNKLALPNIQLGYSHTIGFYPNTRTDISFKYSAQYIQIIDQHNWDADVFGAEGKGAKATTNLVVNYYISPRFRINVNWSLSYIWQESPDDIVFDFDRLFGKDFTLYNPDLSNTYYDPYKNKELINHFNIRLLYSIY